MKDVPTFHTDYVFSIVFKFIFFPEDSLESLSRLDVT